MLQAKAKQRLDELGYHNIRYRHADGGFGWPVKAPFDAIIVTAAAESVPNSLLEQLNQGGIMVIPVGDDEQQLLKITRQGEHYSTETVEMVRFVPLIAGDLA